MWAGGSWTKGGRVASLGDGGWFGGRVDLDEGREGGEREEEMGGRRIQNYID